VIGWTEADLAKHLEKFGDVSSKRLERRIINAEGAGSTPAVSTKPSKYRAIKTVTSDGMLCDSKAEARRWEELRLLFLAGLIKWLLPHPSFPLVVNGMRTGRMTFDALYVDGGVLICEDTKSPITAKTTSYRQRLRTFQACYPHIAVREHIS
jgi:hypothetical protein